MIDSTQKKGVLQQPTQAQQNQPTSPTPGSKAAEVVKTTLRKKDVEDSHSEIESKQLKDTDISQDYLSSLPNELLIKIAALCGFQSLEKLAQCSLKLRSIAQEVCFTRLVGKPPIKTLQKIETNAKNRIDKVCCRFEALYEKFKKGEAHIPKDAINLYTQVKDYHRYNEAKKLEKVLDTRDNLIFWEKMSLSQFNVDKANSYLEIKKAYSQINKSSANFSKKIFDLNGCKLTSIPSDLSHFQIEKLDLEKNYITELPKQFGEMLCLRSLDLNHNDLSSLPENFGKLSQLETLILDNNNLSSLPKSFGKLGKLETLALGNNNLSSLPKNFGKLGKLAWLDLSSNKLSSLPKSFSRLSQLEELALEGNQFEKFPSVILHIPILQELFINHQFLDSEEVKQLMGKGVQVESE